MPHVRKQIRDAVVLQLTGLTTTGARVFNGRVYSYESTELPALSVDTTDESSVMDRTIHGAAWVQRSITLEIQAKAKGTGLVDLLDTIASEVEVALAAGISVGGNDVDLDYGGVSLQLSGDTDQPVGLLTIRYSAQAWTIAGTPDTLV